MPRRSYTVGVIGLGYGRAHIPAFQANGCQVVAVSQRDGPASREANCQATAVVQVSARPTKIYLARLRTAGEAPRVIV